MLGSLRRRLLALDINDKPAVFVDWIVHSSSFLVSLGVICSVAEGSLLGLHAGCFSAKWHSVSKTRRNSFSSLGEIKLAVEAGGISRDS